MNKYIYFKMAIEIAESALKSRVCQVSGNTAIFLGLITLKKTCSQIKRIARKERVLNLLTY